MKLVFLTLCVLAAPLHAVESSIGRLFYTPEQRTRLDAMRQHNPLISTGKSTSTFNGEVRRSTGPDTHWLNGQTQPGKIPQSAPMRIGDSLDHHSGNIHSLFSKGQVLRDTP